MSGAIGYTLTMFFSRPINIVTHSGSFHADDIFACAVLALYHERKGKCFKITRTRDQELIEKADIVLDVGGIDDPSTQRFDHHQTGGAGKRDNGIPYAAFGLIWKEYGPLLCDNAEIVEDIDRRLVQPIDAVDNGVSISESIECGLYDYGIHGIVSAYQCTWKEAGETKKQYRHFMKLVKFFKEVLERELERSSHRLEMIDLIQKTYDEADRKDVLEIPHHVSIGPLMQVLDEHKEVKYIVAKSNTNWKAMALREKTCSFESRKPFPKPWAGKRNEELREITGVPDALFCHNALWLAVAETKEGAWKLAELGISGETNHE
jgi:uncharacterized UPF0160 family protein